MVDGTGKTFTKTFSHRACWSFVAVRRFSGHAYEKAVYKMWAFFLGFNDLTPEIKNAVFIYNNYIQKILQLLIHARDICFWHQSPQFGRRTWSSSFSANALALKYVMA